MQARGRRSMGSFELLCWSCSSVLLGLYASGTLYLLRSQEQAIAAFRSLQRAAPHLQAADANLPESAVKPLSKSLQTAAPDTTSWSATRLASYNAAPAAGAPQAILRIRALDLEVPIYLGATEWNMNRGAAWIEGTAPIGSSGNTGLAAHRDGFFRPLGRIAVGDEVEIETAVAQLRYRVTQTRIVAPQAVEELAHTASSTVTLVTCYPFYFVGPAPQRFIVRAELLVSTDLGAVTVSTQNFAP